MSEAWNKLRLAELCKVFTDGDWIETKHQSSYGIRLIQTGNIGIGQFKNRKNKARYISDYTFKKLNCTEIFKNDCLVSRLPDPVGRSCIIPNIKERMITAVDCTIIRFDEEKIIPEFFNYYSQSLQYLNDVAKKTTGATRKRISRKNLGEVQIPLPPIPEQKRIVKILDKAFAAIDKAKANAEKNLQNSRELFESYLNKIFANPGEDWEEKKLIDVCTLQRGFDLPKRLRKNGQFPLASSSGIIDTHNEYKVEGPGVVTGRSGSVGNVFFISENYWPLNTVLYVKDFHDNNPMFVYHLLKQFDMKKYASGAGVPTLNRNNVHNVLIKIPSSIEKQKEIVKDIEDLYAETKKLETIYQQKLANLEELKKSILQKAFNGEL